MSFMEYPLNYGTTLHYIMGTLQSATLHNTKYYVTTYILNYVTQIRETPLSGPLWGISNIGNKEDVYHGSKLSRNSKSRVGTIYRKTSGKKKIQKMTIVKISEYGRQPTIWDTFTKPKPKFQNCRNGNPGPPRLQDDRSRWRMVAEA